MEAENLYSLERMDDDEIDGEIDVWNVLEG